MKLNRIRKMKTTIITFCLFFLSLVGFGQITTVTRNSTMIKSNHNFGLTNPVYNEGSDMLYDMDTDTINKYGGAFSLNYINQDGGTNFDGYPSGTIGGYKTGGTYYPSNFATSGMPIQIQYLGNDLRIKWKTFQENANDADDKWWATINVIFDSTAADQQPQVENRLYDVVIQFEKYELESFIDKANDGNGAYWWFARNPDTTIIPFVLTIEGVEYKWAIRYKYFEYPSGDPNFYKNEKVHVKFIPFNNTLPSELNHPLKRFIDASKSYIDSIPLLPTAEKTLANLRVADPNLWIKSISAGYEVYDGTSTLGQEYFYTILDNTNPNAPVNLSAVDVNNEVQLNWDIDSTDSYESYTVYRSENEGAYSVLASSIYTNSFIDTTVNIGNAYDYYVTVLDRSFNESAQSNISSISVLSVLDNEIVKSIRLYPNPVQNTLYLQGDFDSKNIEVYDVLGHRINVRVEDNQIDVNSLKSGLYFVKIDKRSFKFIKN